jgi:glycosyltransferase involved in cell wall biosynthesis
MQSQKKLKVLMCSEASFLSSGFGVYAKEILSRLYDTNKYEIAEFASYGFVNDPRDTSIKWRYYANAVKSEDTRYQEYMSRSDNQFGRWRFEKVLLDFRPDVVIDVRDYWMNSYQRLSPLRKFFHWILMPTVDSEPQQEEWIDTFLSADGIFTYSDWGADVLKKQTVGKIKYVNTVSPGVDLATYKPCSNSDKHTIRSQLGVPENAFVIGSVMRNQKRKLIPELFNVLGSIINDSNINESLRKNIYLYMHTSYPDAGWDLPQLLKEYNCINRVLFSYVCKKCNFIQANVFVGPVKVCPRCIEKSMSLSSVTHGVSTKELAHIYNTFDLYVQYSICEGFGMPQVEAAACGIPVATVNYSAMCDVVNKLKAHGIPIAAYFKELETQAIRTYPDNNDLIKYIVEFYNNPNKTELSTNIRTLTETHYNWDNIAKKWESYLDSLADTHVSKWNDPPKMMTKISNEILSKNLSNSEIIQYIFDRHLRDHEEINKNALEMLKQSDYGFTINGMSITGYSTKDIVEYFNTIIDNNNQAEHARINNLKFNDDYIEYANIKDK